MTTPGSTTGMIDPCDQDSPDYEPEACSDILDEDDDWEDEEGDVDDGEED